MESGFQHFLHELVTPNGHDLMLRQSTNLVCPPDSVFFSFFIFLFSAFFRDEFPGVNHA